MTDTFTIKPDTTIEDLRAWMRRVLADTLPQEYIDLACERADLEFATPRVKSGCAITGTINWDATQEGFDFWHSVSDFVLGYDSVLPPIPSGSRSKPAEVAPITITINQRMPHLEEAIRIVQGDRNDEYGHPFDDFGRIADFWTHALKNKLKPGERIIRHEVALCMDLLKSARLCHNPRHHDGWTDKIGYPLCIDMIENREKELNTNTNEH